MRKVLALIMAIIMVLSSSVVMAESLEAAENLFSVEITIPIDFIDEENTKVAFDKLVEEGRCKSVTANEDGSITVVMSKKQHEELLEELKISIDAALVELIETNGDTTIVSIEANEDYTEFKAILSSDTVGLIESFSVLALYMYGGMYNVYAGINIDNISVAFINQATNEVIETFNLADMADQ